jgi:hypothetical protein
LGAKLLHARAVLSIDLVSAGIQSDDAPGWGIVERHHECAVMRVARDREDDGVSASSVFSLKAHPRSGRLDHSDD